MSECSGCQCNTCEDRGCRSSSCNICSKDKIEPVIGCEVTIRK